MTQDNADAKLPPELYDTIEADLRAADLWQLEFVRRTDGGYEATTRTREGYATLSRPQSADAGVESAVKSVQRRLAELTGDRRIDDELRFELRTAIRYIQEDARHPSSDATPKQADEPARPDGLVEQLERLTLENGPIVIDKWGEELAWRPIDYGTWTALRASPAQTEADAGGVGEALASQHRPVSGTP